MKRIEYHHGTDSDADNETVFAAIKRVCPEAVVVALVRKYGGSHVWLPCLNDLDNPRSKDVVQHLGIDAVRQIADEILPADLGLRIYVPLSHVPRRLRMKRIANTLRDRGMTVPAIARKLGVSERTIYRYVQNDARYCGPIRQSGS